MHEPESDRRARRPGETPGPPVDRTGRTWHVRSLEAARQVLRARGATTQAGFTAEHIPLGMRHRPILIGDGPEHDARRRTVARFFTPGVVRDRYGPAVADAARRWLDDAGGEAHLDEVALYFTVDATARIVGLTPDGGRPQPRRVRAMARRLVAMFDQPPFDLERRDLGRSARQWMRAAVNALVPIGRFWWADVRPAIRRRRAHRHDDVVAHLVDEGATDLDILVEAVTYGTAGMVTTREFITMAAWHLLTEPGAPARYLAAGDDERAAILHEVLRLEPVVGHLYRRCVSDLEIDDGDHTHRLRPGDLVDVPVRATNTDPQVFSPQPHCLRPGRETPRAVAATGLSFGDGAHVCVGRHLAIAEADAFLRELLAREPELLAEPTVGWDELVSGYTLRGLVVRWGGAPEEFPRTESKL